MRPSVSELIALLLVGCAKPPPPVVPQPPPPPEIVHTPPFRWSTTGNACEESPPDTCLAAGSDRDNGPFLLAMYPRVAGESQSALVAYQGIHLGGQRKWQLMLSLGGTPVMALGADRAVVAVAGDGVELAVVDTGDGVLEGTKRVSWPATAVQLRADDGFVDVFALDRDGSGHVGIFDPRRLEMVATTVIPASAIQLAVSPRATAGATTAQLAEAMFELVADGDRELLRRRDGWSSLVAPYRSSFAEFSVYATSIALLVVVAEPHEEGTTVTAFDAHTGHIQWVHEFPRLHDDAATHKVRSYVDGAFLVVQLADADGMTSCALALSDGHEVASVTGIVN